MLHHSRAPQTTDQEKLPSYSISTLHAALGPENGRPGLSVLFGAGSGPLGVNLDANVKNNHYQNCGRATTAAYAGLSPLYGTFFGRGPGVAGAITSQLIANLGGLQGEAGEG
jgi:hypothetical protein